MTTPVEPGLVTIFGGIEAIRTRVGNFRTALDLHKLTEDIPAPVEHELIEQLARSPVQLSDIVEGQAGPTISDPPRYLDPSSIVSRLQPYASALRAAVNNNDQMWMFWQRMVGRNKPIDTNDPEFPQAWQLLNSVLPPGEGDRIFNEVMAERF